MFADESGDEAAAANFAAGFHSAVSHEQIAPGGCERFARQKIPKNYAPAVEKQLCEKYYVGCLGFRTVEQSPASSGMAGALRSSGAAFGIEQCAEIIESVGGDQTRCDQFPQRIFDLARQASARFHKLDEERCAAFLKRDENIARLMRQRSFGARSG